MSVNHSLSISVCWLLLVALWPVCNAHDMTRDDRRARLGQAGRWLREQRERHGFTRAVDFARALGVDASLVSNYERGVNAVDDERARKIADVLGLDEVAVRRGLNLWTPSVPAAHEMVSAALQELGESEAWAAQASGLDADRWHRIAEGEDRGTPIELARMARAVGVQSFRLRAAGHAEVANAVQDLELDEKYGDKSNQELLDESEQIAQEVQAALRNLGRDLDARQKRVLQRWAQNLIETLAEFDRRNEAS